MVRNYRHVGTLARHGVISCPTWKCPFSQGYVPPVFCESSGRERPLWRSGSDNEAVFSFLRNATEGVPYRTGVQSCPQYTRLSFELRHGIERSNSGHCQIGSNPIVGGLSVSK